MYIGIDRSNMRMLHKFNQQRVVSLLVDMEAPHVSTVVMSCESSQDFEKFTDLELKLLYHNTCGQNLDSLLYHTSSGLQSLCAELAANFPCSDVDPFEVDRQHAYIKEGDKERYHYVKGSTKPAIIDELFELPKPVVKAPENAEEKARTKGTGKPASSPAALVMPGIGASTQPKPRAAPTGPANKPATGTTTGRVWEICDTVLKEFESLGRMIDKSMRTEIVQRCLKAGINNSTASVQYSKWNAARSR